MERYISNGSRQFRKIPQIMPIKTWNCQFLGMTGAFAQGYRLDEVGPAGND